METEYRFSEFRREGRTLSGKGIVYGDVARVGAVSERFLPGAFGDVSKLDVILNAGHDRSRPLARSGGGLTLTDSATALDVVAELPETREASDTLALVEARVLRGFSIEFVPVQERMEAATRVLVSARLVGIAVVDRPAYRSSTISARAEAEAANRARDLLHLREFML